MYSRFTDSNVVTSISLRLAARLFQAGPCTASVPKIQGKTDTTHRWLRTKKLFKTVSHLWLQCDVTVEKETAYSPIDYARHLVYVCKLWQIFCWIFLLLLEVLPKWCQGRDMWKDGFQAPQQVGPTMLATHSLLPYPITCISAHIIKTRGIP